MKDHTVSVSNIQPVHQFPFHRNSPNRLSTKTIIPSIEWAHLIIYTTSSVLLDGKTEIRAIRFKRRLHINVHKLLYLVRAQVLHNQHDGIDHGYPTPSKYQKCSPTRELPKPLLHTHGISVELKAWPLLIDVDPDSRTNQNETSSGNPSCHPTWRTHPTHPQLHLRS
jgi:hypothetical protein